MDNTLIEEIQGWAKLCTGKQREFYRDMLEAAKPVEVVRAVDVLTPEQMDYLLHVVNPIPKHCYRNAYLLAEAFPNEIQYCECKVAIPFGIDHAINKIGDSYIDITFEFALEDCPERYDYVVIGEWELKKFAAWFVKPECMAICTPGHIGKAKKIPPPFSKDDGGNALNMESERKASHKSSQFLVQKSKI